MRMIVSTLMPSGLMDQFPYHEVFDKMNKWLRLIPEARKIKSLDKLMVTFVGPMQESSVRVDEENKRASISVVWEPGDDVFRSLIYGLAQLGKEFQPLIRRIEKRFLTL